MQRLLLFCTIVGLANALVHIGLEIKKQGIKNGKFHNFVQKYSSNTTVKACADFNTELKIATSDAERCVDETYNPDQDTFCHFISNGFRSCFNSTNAVMEKCLPERSKDVFLFVLDATIELIKTLCEAKTSEIFELLQPCITDSISNPDNNVCFELIDQTLLGFEHKCPTVSDICDFRQKYRDCVAAQLNTECSSSITKRNFFKFYDVSASECLKHQSSRFNSSPLT